MTSPAKSPPKSESKSPPKSESWLEMLKPRHYAKDWFDETGFIEDCHKGFAHLDSTPLGEPQGDLHQAALKVAKPLLAEGRDLIKAKFIQENDGALYVGGYGLVMDAVVGGLFQKITASSEEDSGLALVATGGYGRGELAPHSDIDLLFLTDAPAGKALTKQIETMLYVLWDLGLTVGQAVRSLDEQFEAAGADLTIRTAMLESRHLAGDKRLSDAMFSRFQHDIAHERGIGAVEAFLNGKIKEREERLRRHGTQRYVVEPNVKDGKGGLRDLHTLFWIARYAYQVDAIDSMLDRGILSRRELRQFAQEQRFLWSVRCHLHLRSGRADDRLTFDAQMDIAPQMGFKGRSGMNTVERFMRRYYLAARSVGSLTRIFWAAIAADFKPKPRVFGAAFQLWRRRAAPKPFAIEGGRLNVDKDFHFKEEPSLMLELFRFALNHSLDMHPNALRKIHAGLRLVDHAYRMEAQNNACFLEIITNKQNPERILRMMNDAGFLGRFLPDFGRIVGMMQFDMYHSYTVDEHTLFALGILNGIESGRLSETAPVASKAVHQLTLRCELYVALFLHDIAKGRGGDHSILGAEVALEVCPRLGLDAASTETVAWLVRHHLLMSETAFRYDLNDPTTIEHFAQEVQSPERLNLLLVLTVADIRAVGPTVWNGWKAQLMRDLYTRTMKVLMGEVLMGEVLMGEVLTGGGESEQTSSAEATKARLSADLKEGLKDSWSDEQIAEHLEQFYASYWTSFDRDGYERHAALCRRHAESHEILTVGMTPVPSRNATEVIIITADDAGLFSRMAGGLAAMGAYIVDARITTRKDGLALDVLWIQSADKKAIADADALKRIEGGIFSALMGVMDIDASIARRRLQTPVRIRQIAAPARVLVNDRASTTHTVIEINGKDVPGLLYSVTRKMAEMGLQIQMASVSTYGDRVVDVFYVKDGFGLKISSSVRRQRIEKELLDVMLESDKANRVVA